MSDWTSSWGRRTAVVAVAALTGCTAPASEIDESETEGSSSGESLESSDGATEGDADGSGDSSEDGVPDDSSDDGSDAPACDDGELNGDEEGVDCGGSCQPCPPSEWACDAALYGDGVCQCGCGTLDVDCPSDAIADCAYDVCPDGFALVPGQTLDCTEVPAAPEDWSCGLSRFGDSVCDCGCTAADFDCASASATECSSTHCPEWFSLDPDDNALCLPPPADAVDNPSFEDTPEVGGDIPGWEVLLDVGGMAHVEISGPGQTDAPEGSRALRLVSTMPTSSARERFARPRFFRRPAPAPSRSRSAIPTRTRSSRTSVSSAFARHRCRTRSTS